MSVGVFECFGPEPLAWNSAKYVLISAVSAFLYGSFIFQMFGGGDDFYVVSWEMHLFGLVGGVVAGGLKSVHNARKRRKKTLHQRLTLAAGEVKGKITVHLNRHLNRGFEG